jgi:NitT/TauT family transport system substrate-binding protein
VKDLKGAVIGVTSPGSGSHNFANYVLASHQVPIGSVSIVGIGNGAPAIAAFEHGQIDAAVLMGNVITGIERRSPGVRILADTRTVEGVKAVFDTDVYPAQGLAASPEWLRQNPATARKVVSALMRTLHYMREHPAEEIRSRMPAQYRSPDTEADLKAIREIVPLLSRDGKITPEGAQAVKRVLDVSSGKVRHASIDLSQTYTNEFVLTQ